MSSAELMQLVRELKALNAKKKSGQPLSEPEAKRRKELKAYLRTKLDSSKSGEGAAISASGVAVSGTGPALVVPSSRPPTPAPSQAPAPAPAAVSTPQPLDPPVAAPQPLDPPAPTPTPAKKPFNPRDAFRLDKQAAAKAKAEGRAPAPSASPARTRDAPPPIRAAAPGTGPLAEVNIDPKHASSGQIKEMFQRADEALAAQVTRKRVTTMEEVAEQLAEIDSQYSGSEALGDFEYYGEYFEEGLDFADDAPEDLNVIDPREIELHKAGLAVAGPPEAGGADVVVPAGLAFLDDFVGLYERRILPPPSEEYEPDEEDPNLLVPGRRKVTVHLLDGRSMRGAIKKLERGALGFTLLPTGPGRSQDFSMAQIKALFIHRPPKAPPSQSPGRAITVTFRDRRKIQGATDDYQPGQPIFSIVPSGKMAQFERIVINVQAVTNVA